MGERKPLNGNTYVIEPLASYGDSNEVPIGKVMFLTNGVMQFAKITPVNVKTVKKQDMVHGRRTDEGLFYEDNYCPNCGAKMDGDIK